MNIEKLKSQLKREAYQRPEVQLVTPEIRTIDERRDSDILRVVE